MDCGSPQLTSNQFQGGLTRMDATGCAIGKARHCGRIANPRAPEPPETDHRLFTRYPLYLHTLL